ncbi:MAG: hypothetical protein WC661_18830 [Opitutaceae bacterium]|jgi:hypothetical protein
MKPIKNLLGIGLAVLGLLGGVAVVEAVENCPLPKNPGSDDSGGTANDPVFFLAEAQPSMGVKEKLGRLREQVISRTNSSGEQDQAVLKAYEDTRKATPAGIYDSVLAVWGQPVSAELKQYILLSSLTLVKTTEQVETLRFMLASLNDLPAQTGQLASLSKGNGLEKAKAARLMGILSKNPQFKL